MIIPIIALYRWAILSMNKLRQKIAFLAFRSFQKRQPATVEVLGKTYRTDRHVFNPKFYMTSKFVARNIEVEDGSTVLDMGSGAGIQAITAAGKAEKVIAIDINFSAARKTMENALANGVADKVFVIQSDLFDALHPRAKFDLIIFTPPYMEGMPAKDIERAWFDPGKKLARRFFEEAAEHLKPGGAVQMIYSSLAAPERVLDIAQELGWRYIIDARKRSLLETFYIYRFRRKNNYEAPAT